jgi:predicted O-methyltransferase YrrM
LGTSLGVSTLYFDTNLSKVDTIDINEIGKKIISEYSAVNNFNLSNLTFHIGDFESKIPEYLEENKMVDIVFIDGDHTYESTIKNTEILIPYLSENSCIVLDDIRWNNEMYKAWEELKTNFNFNYTLDFGRIGILMKTNNHAPKQHFILHL